MCGIKCVFVWFLTTHQPDVDVKSKNLLDKIKAMMMMSLFNDNKLQYDC